MCKHTKIHVFWLFFEVITYSHIAFLDPKSRPVCVFDRLGLNGVVWIMLLLMHEEKPMLFCTLAPL